jgi:hypothetical protein
MHADVATEFDAELRSLVLRYRDDGLITSRVTSTVVWGLPGS